MAYIYRHIRLDKNEPFYIGIGSDDTGKFKRAYSINERNRFWNFIINKTSWVTEIVIDNLTWEEACEKEKELIKLYGRKDKSTGILCNLTDGGEGSHGVIASSETRMKISEALKGKPKGPMTLVHKNNLSKSLLGKNKGKNKPARTEAHCKNLSVSHKGNIHSEETKLKMSNSHKGRKHSNESKLKMSKLQKGRIISEESKLKMSQSAKGRKHSESTKLKISEARKMAKKIK
jgi:hypothetical protein